MVTKEGEVIAVGSVWRGRIGLWRDIGKGWGGPGKEKGVAGEGVTVRWCKGRDEVIKWEGAGSMGKGRG